MLHVSVENVDAWYDHVCRFFDTHTFPTDARISNGIKDESYGRVFHVWDPGGALLHFAQFK